MTSQTPISAQGVFEHWARARQGESAGARRLSDASLATFGWNWKSWCDYLEQQALPWQQARAAHVQRFLANLPSTRVKRAARTAPARALTTSASGVTKSRYARLLQEVYALALVRGWVASNPVPAGAISGARGESLVLKGPWLELLVQGAAARERSDWVGLRDTAMLLLMSQLALTVAELRRLKLGDIVHPRLPPSGHLHWLGQQEIPTAAPRSPVRIELAGSRQRGQASRSLVLPPAARAALTDWLHCRLLGLPEAVSRARTSALFVSRKGFGVLTAKTIFTVANAHIAQVLGAHFRGPNGQLALAHAGPTTLRNSCIDAWLAAPGADVDEVAARAGLKDAASLARLRARRPAAAGQVPA